jgi:hypothetical protein
VLSPHDDRSLLSVLIGDGRSLLMLTGLALIASGGFAIFQSATGQFLPHDVQYLGMTAVDLCGMNQCRVVHFMFHDRVSFGGTLIAIGSLYLWLAAFPLADGEAWAWWMFAISGLTGFSSFLAYLGYGYLDQWHLWATLFLLPVFGYGLIRTRRLIPAMTSPRCLLRPFTPLDWRTPFGVGRACLLMTSALLGVGGLVITYVGMTRVFVPQDLEYMGVSAAFLNDLNPRLIPVIAHDRAGFGGGLFTTSLTVLICLWCARPSRSLWQVLAFAGSVGFITAVGVHPVIGYLSLSHLAPAVMVSLLFLVGIALCFRPMVFGQPSQAAIVPPVSLAPAD